MRKQLYVTVLSIALGLTAAGVQAEENKPVLSPKSPVNSVDGVLYPKGQVGIIFKSVLMNKDATYDGNSDISPKSNAPKEKEISVYNLIGRYGLFENVEVKFKIPYKEMSIEREAPVSSPEFDNSGLADSTVWLRYQILSQKRKDPVFLWAGAGLNIPTGETDAKTNGKLDPMTMQIGDGSWDPIVDIGVTKKVGNAKFNAYASYTFSTEGDNDYRWGNTFQFDLSTVYAFNEYLAIDLELNNVWKEKDEVNGQSVGTTGGFQSYITPGVHVMWPGTKHHLALGVPITIYRDLNGPQLSEDYRVILKAAFVF
ncbi:transporter [bacterium]|nr:transporter [bacterium]